MKVTTPSLVFLWALFPAVVFPSDQDHDEEDHDDDVLCSAVNVTDAASCEAWCGGSNETEYTYTSRHADFEDMHVDVLSGWECECPESDDTDEHLHCITPYEMPTCAEMGLGDCINATMTCGELCVLVGLGLENSTTFTTATERRFLGHVTDTHFCAHHEGDDHGDDHDRRHLAEDENHQDHHDHEEEVTICYCNANEENARSSTIACSDVELKEDHEGSHDGGSRAVGNALAGLAVGSLVGLICVVLA